MPEADKDLKRPVVAAVVLVLLFIYYFSSIPGLQVIPFLAGTYHFLTDLFPFLKSFQSIINGHMPGEFRFLANAARENPGLVDFILRKAAHVLEFFILTLLLFPIFSNLKNNTARYVVPGAVSFITACSDEFHQLYTLDRQGRFIDVGIDALGIILAFLIIFIYEIIRRRKTRQ